MALETGTFVDDLITTNPLGTDAKSQGDDHLRLIKTVLKGTFPNSSRALRFPIATAAKTGAYTVLIADANSLIRGDATGGGFTITLPLLSTVFAGFIVTIMKSDTSANVVTVDGNGAETINGATTRALAKQFEVETYESEGSEWKVISSLTEDREDSVIASATTTEIWGTDGRTRHISGTTNITSLGTAPRAGASRRIIFDDTLLLSNSANLALPGGADITTAAGDFAFVYADTTAQLDLLYFKKDGTAVIGTVISQADQAAMEAQTDENTYVPPDLVKHSPGVAKVWVKWEQTGAHGLLVSYNMDSVTDGGGVGDTDHLWTVDFSGTDYVLLGSGHNGASDLLGVKAAVATFAAGGVTTITRRSDTAALADADHASMAIWGDQA